MGKYVIVLFLCLAPLNSRGQFWLSQEARDSIYNQAKINQGYMMQVLGIDELRPGADGNTSSPNAANYNEDLANPCPELPPLLTTDSGKEVKTEKIWWDTRRPEIKEVFEREVYGKIPENVPEVHWETPIVDHEWVRRTPVIAKKLVGRVDNSAHPSIQVNIDAVLVVPANVEGPVPVLVMFGRPSLPAPAQPSQEDLETINQSFKEMMIAYDPELKAIFEKYPAYSPITRLPPPNFWEPLPEGDLPSTEQLLQAGWGYVTLDANSIQPDNGAGLTSGIIGLTNKGKQRKPDQWGALRAWGWGASKVLDYLETEALVDSHKVGIEGVSRYGKAALVGMAFDQRFAVGLIGSSGKGGATLHRRVYGEAVENLAGSGSFHWMAGNYLKYAAKKAEFGSKKGCDLPVDSHQLIAMCAPRPTFISYGIPEKGDAHWLDQKGSYMATVAAGGVYKLLGAEDLGVSNDYRTEQMPPPNTDLLDGSLAWRQHDGGHTDWPNMKYFIPWANGLLDYAKQ